MPKQPSLRQYSAILWLFLLCCCLVERKWKIWLLSGVWLFETPWTIAPQAHLSMGFSRQEYWIGLPFTSQADLPDSVTETWVSESRLVVFYSLWPHGLYSPGNSLCQNTEVGSQNTGVGSDSFLQGIFPTQRLNPGLPHCRWILYQMSHKGSPRILDWVAYPFSRGSSWPKNKTGVSCIAGRFFTNWAIPDLPYCRQILYCLSN